MNSKITTIIKISLFVLPIALFYSNALAANELDRYVSNYDSIYRYNALENRASFADFVNSVNNF